MNNKNFIIVTIILIIIAVISLVSYLPTMVASEQEAQMADFPTAVGEWQGKDIPLNERDYAILETKNLIMREYKNAAGDSVFLYIIYSAGNRKVVHPPEICYSGGGSTIVEKSVVPVTSSIQANRFAIEDKDSRQIVVYWFRAANFNTYNFFRQQLKMVIARTLRRKTSGAMVRISTVTKDNNDAAALVLVKQFCAEIEPLLDRYVP